MTTGPPSADPCHPSIGRCRRLTNLAIGAIALWLSAPLALVRADQVNTPEGNFVNVAVSGYAEGQLLVRRPDGAMESISLADTVRLVIDTVGGLADFNDAERYFEQGQHPQAIARYERALRVAQGIWAPIILHRLVQACDAAGRLDRAGTYFLKVAEQSPRAAAAVMPTHLPKRRTKATRRLVDRLHTAARQTTSSDRRVLLDLFAFSIIASTGQPQTEQWAAQIARTDVPLEIATPAVYAVKIGALQEVLGAGQTESALISIDAALNDCPSTILPDLLLLKGQTLLDRQADRQDLLGAGLCFMKVAIHFPDDGRAPAALFGAARAHDKLEQPDLAVQLLNECLAHDRIGAALRSRAEVELARIRTALAG